MPSGAARGRSSHVVGDLVDRRQTSCSSIPDSAGASGVRCGPAGRREAARAAGRRTSGEGLDLVLAGRVGPGLVGRVGDAELGAGHERGVLLVGLAPHLGERVDVVVDPLDGVLVDEPGGAHQRAVRCQRQHRERHRVVGERWIQALGWWCNDSRPEPGMSRSPSSAATGRDPSMLKDSPAPSSGSRWIRKPNRAIRAPRSGRTGRPSAAQRALRSASAEGSGRGPRGAGRGSGPRVALGGEEGADQLGCPPSQW